MTRKMVRGTRCRAHRPRSKQLQDGCEHGVTSAVMRATFRLVSSWLLAIGRQETGRVLPDRFPRATDSGARQVANSIRKAG